MKKSFGSIAIGTHFRDPRWGKEHGVLKKVTNAHGCTPVLDENHWRDWVPMLGNQDVQTAR